MNIADFNERITISFGIDDYYLAQDMNGYWRIGKRVIQDEDDSLLLQNLYKGYLITYHVSLPIYQYSQLGAEE